MHIYVASSWRNTYYPEVVQALRDAGHVRVRGRVIQDVPRTDKIKVSKNNILRLKK